MKILDSSMFFGLRYIRIECDYTIKMLNLIAYNIFLFIIKYLIV